METRDLISVIVPVYNTEKYLSQCIESVLSQEHENLELLLVNDCSTDSSLNICKNYEAKDDRIKVLENKKNCGLGFSRNRGLDAAAGKYLFFLDSDDWIPKNALSDLLLHLLKTNADFCGGVISSFNQNTGVYSPDFHFLNDGTGLSTYFNWSMCNKLFKSDFIKNNGIREPENFIYGEDAATYPVIHELAKNICLKDSVTYFYRRFAGSSTMDNNLSALQVPLALSCMVENFKKRNLPVNGNKKLFDTALRLSESSIVILDKAVQNKFYNPYDFLNLQVEIYDILHKNFPEFLYEECRKSFFKKNVLSRQTHFYMKNLECLYGHTIVLYGAGKVGQDLYAQICLYRQIKIASWLDKNFQNIDFDFCKVESMQKVNELDFDIIVIGVLEMELAKEIKKSLVDVGVPVEKIIYPKLEKK